MSLVGKSVAVHTKGGKIYDGILHGVNMGADLGVALTMARERVGPTEPVAPYVKQIVFLVKDFAQLVAHDVDLFDDEVTEGTRTAQGGEMLADTEIEVAGRGTGEGRDLQGVNSAWLSGGGGGGIALNPNQGAGEWDQFAANKQQFNVESSYNFDDYTTKLEKGKFSAKQLAEAERIAREIEGKATTNPHLAEERGQLRQDEATDDLDEEARYSAVLDAPNAPTMPAWAGGPPPSLGAGASKPAGSQPPLPGAQPPGAPMPAAPTDGAAAAAPPAAKPVSKLNANAGTFVSAEREAAVFVPGGGGGGSRGFTPPAAGYMGPPQGTAGRR